MLLSVSPLVLSHISGNTGLESKGSKLNSITIQPFNPTPRSVAKRNENSYSNINLHTNVQTALFTIAER